jgi:hypothetical protein
VIAVDVPHAVERRQAAAAERALACAEALGRDIHALVESEPLARRHAPRLRRLARRSDTLGLPCLAEAARLAVAALTAARRDSLLLGQAIDVLTLAGQAARRGARADLHPVVEALRDHLGYAGTIERERPVDAGSHD